jgi:hypothetical protein
MGPVTNLDQRRAAVPVGPDPVPRGVGWPGRLTAVGVPTALVCVHGLLYGRWIVDDAAITFAYARSITSGAGPVLQPGAEVVEGYSNPAWLVLLGLGRVLGLFDRGAWFGVPDYVAFPKLLALLLVAGVFACVLAIATALTRHPVVVTVVAGATTAAVPSFVIWTVSGLENALLALCAVAIAAVLVRGAAVGSLLDPRTAVACGLLAALAALTRPDGLIHAGAYPLAVLLVLRRTDLAAAARAVVVSTVAFAVPAGAYLVWRLTTFGEWLPNTALAKSQGLPGAAELARPGEIVGYAGWLAALLAAVAIGAALARSWPGRRGLVVLLVPLALAVAAFGVLEGDWMGELRFATPVWPLGATATAVSAAHLLPALAARGRTVAAVLALVAGAATGASFADGVRAFRAAPTAPLCVVATNTGTAFNGYSEVIGGGDHVLLAPDIGGAAMTSTLRVVDLVGLADSRIAAFWAAGDLAGLRDHVFSDVRPTFITINPDWSRVTGLPADPRMAAYVEIGTSPAGVTDWVRQDALAPGDLDALRARAAAVARPADLAVRAAPRGSCGDALVPPS